MVSVSVAVVVVVVAIIVMMSGKKPTTSSSAHPTSSSSVATTSSVAPTTSSVAPTTSSVAPTTSSVAPTTSSVAPTTSSSAVPTTSSSPDTTVSSYIQRDLVKDEGVNKGQFGNWFGTPVVNVSDTYKNECDQMSGCMSFTMCNGSICYFKDKVVTAIDESSPDIFKNQSCATYYKTDS